LRKNPGLSLIGRLAEIEDKWLDNLNPFALRQASSGGLGIK
jgi:hypothetical protein